MHKKNCVFGKVWLQMNWIEVALLIFGVGAFAGSFLIRGKSADEEEEQHVDIELIRTIIEKEMGDAKERVAEVVDETLEYAVEKQNVHRKEFQMKRLWQSANIRNRAFRCK